MHASVYKYSTLGIRSDSKRFDDSDSSSLSSSSPANLSSVSLPAQTSHSPLPPAQSRRFCYSSHILSIYCLILLLQLLTALTRPRARVGRCVILPVIVSFSFIRFRLSIRAYTLQLRKYYKPGTGGRCCMCRADDSCAFIRWQHFSA